MWSDRERKKNGQIKRISGEFPGGPVARTLYSQSKVPGSIPGQGTKIPHVMWCGQKKKREMTFLKRELQVK